MLFGITILLSAALVFMIQPMLAKQLLPYFGGGAAVWTACMLFFQTLLLAGYAYAHLLGRLLSPGRQRLLHSMALILALLLAVVRLSLPEPVNSSMPLIDIVAYLLQVAGLPYLLLSATGPLLQHWFAQRYPTKSPYQLYALSNLGSVGGLLCYPFILEPWLALDQQWHSWLSGFMLFAIAMLYLMWRHLPAIATEVRSAPLRLRQRQAHYWLALSACGVMLLLAVTQQITQNITPVPFLWVLPLLLYLLSYILVFSRSHWYQRALWVYVFCLNLVIALALFYLGQQFDVLLQLLFYLLILFSGCMLCHGELARSKPEPAALTAFYFWLALGGAVGSLLMNILLPLLFVRHYEFLLCLLAIYLLVLLPATRNKVLPLTAAWLGAAAVFCIILYLEFHNVQQRVFSGRNFYGSVQVRDVNINGQLQRQLIDGTTNHGSQYLDAELSRQAQSYYRAGTGAALALQHFLASAPERSVTQLQQRRVGLIGLGAGALAAYGNAGDSYVFYEINPLVITAATSHFSYLSDSAANIDIVTGDGRLQLQQQLARKAMQFDVLVLDAFSSDSIPQHLLTEQAMQLYWQHLMRDGVLAVHVSNNYLDLTSLLRNQALRFGKQALFIATSAAGTNPAAEWVLITANRRFTGQAVIQQAIRPWPTELRPEVRWTDQRSDLLQLLK